MSDTVYLIPQVREQERLTLALCHGTCGQAPLAPVMLGALPMVACLRADCPHVEREVDGPDGLVDGRRPVLRRLRAVR